MRRCGKHVIFGSHSLVCRCETVRVAFAEIGDLLYGQELQVGLRNSLFFIFCHSLTSKFNLFDKWFRNLSQISQTVLFLRWSTDCGQLKVPSADSHLPQCCHSTVAVAAQYCDPVTPAPASYMNHDNQCVSWPTSDSLRDAGCLNWIFSFPSTTDSLFPVEPLEIQSGPAQSPQK